MAEMVLSREPLVAFIRQTHHINGDVAAHIASLFRPRSLVKGELFLKEGKISNEYLFLQTGSMRAFLYDTEGAEVTVNLYTAGSVVFEIASFFQRVPSEENLEALTACSGWSLTFEELNALFHAIPEFREFGRAVLVKGFIGLKRRTISMINKTAEQRYGQLLHSRPEIFQHIPLKYIASYLGITDTSLSRIRKDLLRKDE